MYNNFIPAFHFIPAEEKLKPQFCWDAINWCWYNTGRRNLLHNKNIEEIEGYATGNFSMSPYRRMYKSEEKNIIKYENELNNSGRFQNLNDKYNFGIGFIPLPLIPSKLSSAKSIIQKIPIEIEATAIDPLAAQKKSEDLVFLKNKPVVEAALNNIADKMGVADVDLGETKHSATPFSNSPYGLDLNEPDELQVFVDLLYNLAVEAALETVLEEFKEIKNVTQIKGLEIKDQFYYGVSCNRSYKSTITTLPDIEYVYPGSIEVPYSDLPDMNDNAQRFIHIPVTPLELFNYFSDEICDEEMLERIVNEPGFGYSPLNGGSRVDEKNFTNYKMDLVYCEIRSVDYVGISKLNKKSKYTYFTNDTEQLKTCTDKIWGQNTYCFYWLRNTKYFFGIDRLPFAYRTVGQETYQNFSSNINKTQEKSAVEMAIGENKKAQVADIKMQHAIITSLPAGRYIDLRFMRGVLTGLSNEENKYTMQDLLTLAMEKNTVLGDTEGFDGKNDGQFKAVLDLPGGVKSEVVGYMQVISDANAKIDIFMGTNNAITGQNQDPNSLIGLEKLKLSAGINSLYYITEGIEQQYQKLFTNWATLIKQAVKEGGKAKEAIINLIGSKKESLIEALDDLPLHDVGIKITVQQREEEKEQLRQDINMLKTNGVLNVVDEYQLSAITNPKDKMALVAVKYKQWQKMENKKRAEDQAQKQAMIKAQGQNAIAAEREKTSGAVQQEYAKGDVSAQVLKLAAQLGIQSSQMDFVGKKALQQDRGQSQKDKALTTLQKKQDLQNQEPLQQ